MEVVTYTGIHKRYKITEEIVAMTEHTVESVKQQARSTTRDTWAIEYQGASCQFSLMSDEKAVIHHLEVPRESRGQGIGTAILTAVEEIITTETAANVLFAQVGSSNGATRHVLRKKFGYEILKTEQIESIGTVIEAKKQLDKYHL